MTQETERNIRKWVAKGLKLDSRWVIPANENAPDPRSLGSPRRDAPYATMLVVSEKAFSPLWREAEDEDNKQPATSPPTHGIRSYQQIREANVQVSLFRAPNREADLLSYAASEDGNNFSDELDFRVLGITTQVTSKDSSERMGAWEMGTVFDLRIGYAVTWNESFKYPQRVEVDMEV